MSLSLLYVGTSRLHRNRANLIQTLHTVEGLIELGVQARLYLPPFKRADLTDRLADLGIRSPLDVRPSALLHSRWKHCRYRPFVWRHRSQLARADILYCRTAEISLALASASWRHHVEIHDPGDLEARGLLGSIVEYHRRGVIEWLLPISRAAAKQLIARGADPDRIHVSPSGVDVSAFANVPPFEPARLGQPRIVYLGRLSHSRGLRIFEAIAASGIAHVTLVGEQEDEVREMPGLHVAPFVPHREIPNWYARTEIVLLPYQPELAHAGSISPLKLFEAFAAGRPVIASDIPPLRELIEHEHTGLLVEPGDVKGWMEAVERLRRDPVLAVRIAHAVRARAPEYSWRRRVENLARALGWPLPALT